VVIGVHAFIDDHGESFRFMGGRGSSPKLLSKGYFF
jgi:hypothetical protein